MKIDWNRKYTTVAVYTVLTALIIMLLGTLFLNLGAVRSVLSTLNTILIPVYIGFGIAYIANPLMRLAEKHIFRFAVTTERRFVLKRSLSILFAIIVLTLAITILLLLILPQVFFSLSDLSTKLADYLEKTIEWLDDFLPAEVFSRSDSTLNSYLDAFNTFVGSSDIVNQLSSFAKELTQDYTFQSILQGAFTLMKNYLPIIFGYVSGLANGVINTVLGIFFAIYMLASKEKLQAQIKKVLRSVTGEKNYNGIIELGNFANKTFGGYLLGKVLDSLVVGIVMFVACSIFHVPYAILLSTVVAITNVIPVIGPFIGAVPGILIIFIVDPSKVLVFIIINIIIQQIDGNIIVPKLLGETTGLDSLWVLFSITVAGGLWGIFGMFICVPIFAIIYMIAKLGIETKLRSKGLPIETSEYFSDTEMRKFTEHEDNKDSFAARMKHSVSVIHRKSLIERIKKLSKKKSSSGSDTRGKANTDVSKSNTSGEDNSNSDKSE